MGYILSDGHVVSNVSSANDNFGLTASGEWAFGELSSFNVSIQKFPQLLTGFEILTVEGLIASGIEPGGKIAPRTAIGTDRAGNLLMAQVLGAEKSNPKLGMTLFEFAAWVGKMGGYNMLNLDGGGSSTTFYQGSILGCPTCIDYKICCEQRGRRQRQ